MAARTCPECGGPVIEIEVSSGDTPVVMRSCSKCDAREWTADGRDIDLTTALRELSASGGGPRRKE